VGLLTLDIIGRIAAELAVEPREIYRIAISASARYREPTRTDQKRPAFFNCKEGCLGLSFNNA